MNTKNIFTPQPVIFFDVLDSTNTFLLDGIENLPAGYAVAAHTQTGGRGRRGKLWQTPKRGLALSFIVNNSLNPAHNSVIPLLTGLAAAQALTALGVVGIQLKWPNDVLLGGKKLGGILCEATQLAPQKTVCGIGLNLELGENFNPLQGGSLMPAAIFEDAAKQIAAAELAKSILDAFAAIWNMYINGSESECRSIFMRYKALVATIGQNISVITPSSTRHGLCLDVLEDGALLCEIDGKAEKIIYGEVSVRPC